MVIDTSALVAIALGETTRPELLAALEGSPVKVLASVSLLEAGMALRARQGERAIQALYSFVETWGIEIIAFRETHAKLAIAAFARYGKGMGHRAQLNFGDCAVYALALSRGEPVLATGRDFASTDITTVPLKLAPLKRKK